MYLNIWACSCTCVSMCMPVCLHVYKCMDSRQDDWQADGGEGTGQAAVVAVNLCPLLTPARDSSLTGITNMTPGHATLATVSQLSSLISRSLKNPRAAQYSLLYWISPYCKYGLATVDNSKWASVRETEPAQC